MPNFANKRPQRSTKSEPEPCYLQLDTSPAHLRGKPFLKKKKKKNSIQIQLINSV